MTNDELHHLSAAYALDALDDDERAAFEAHLRDCGDCRADVASFGATIARAGRRLHGRRGRRRPGRTARP